ncbi:FAD-dependent oxidoreductase [Dactylosporangium sp. NPDC050688]|uniref:FAD-dependent oxidoreductase n=1 Tax=Dactylosporangium sp. NPDC050688 TaxID=3157217 RepID=UPI0033D3A04F
MNQVKPDAIVIGAGVSGLTTAICLAEAGVHVTIWTAEPTEETTSMAAGAMWGPYHVEPLDRVQAWGAATLDILRRLADDLGTGVRLVSGIEAARELVDPPAWGGQLDRFRMCAADELPPGFAAGWRYTAPLVDMPTYLGYLRRRLADAGGHIERRRVTAFTEAVAEAPVVVNCTGMGARELVPDPDLFPIRGQLVVVENPGLTEFFSEDTGSSPDLLHYYPHGDTLVLGGTAQTNAWSREPDPEVAATIVRRCGEVEPRLRDARIISHRVGLRPTREQVRVESQELYGGRIIHNYGHGGAGVTLSWGCAADAAALTIAALA